MWWLIRRCAGHQSTKQKQQFVEKIVYGSLSSQAAVVDMRVPEESGRMVTAGSLCIEQRCLAVAWCLACSQVYSLHGLQSSNEDALSHSDIAGDVEGCARRAWPCLLPQSVKEPVQSRNILGPCAVLTGYFGASGEGLSLGALTVHKRMLLTKALRERAARILSGLGMICWPALNGDDAATARSVEVDRSQVAGEGHGC